MKISVSVSSAMSLCSGSVSSSIWGNDLSMFNHGGIELLNVRRAHYRSRFGRSFSRIYAMSDGNQAAYKMNLNEYMVTLEKPLGIRLALSIDGKVFVHSLRKGVRNFTSFY